MAKQLEVANWDDLKAVSELSGLMWSQAEPGFQIEGVSDIEQLVFVLDSLKTAVPKQVTGVVNFDSAYPWNGFEQFKPEPQDAHIDTDFTGIAVHQNISTTVPVKLGIARYPWNGGTINEDTATGIREGETIPGRLTVFSEGWPEMMRKTAHFFDRTAGTPIFLSRYTQSTDTPANNIPKIAAESFELLKRYR
ncbi:MAG TPA: hypothetical protein VMR34_01045 [Candidatus Saccharimonadales bacterium]|nr:hypothetical protein [Candidatus Saccharimonadales bacterium]